MLPFFEANFVFRYTMREKSRWLRKPSKRERRGGKERNRAKESTEGQGRQTASWWGVGLCVRDLLGHLFAVPPLSLDCLASWPSLGCFRFHLPSSSFRHCSSICLSRLFLHLPQSNFHGCLRWLAILTHTFNFHGLVLLQKKKTGETWMIWKHT